MLINLFMRLRVWRACGSGRNCRCGCGRNERVRGGRRRRAPRWQRPRRHQLNIDAEHVRQKANGEPNLKHECENKTEDDAGVYWVHQPPIQYGAAAAGYWFTESAIAG